MRSYGVNSANQTWISLRSGFTLIELMIVIAIISLLAAVALPSYRTVVRTNLEEEARARMLFNANDLSSWRSKKLSYENFVPINDCASGKRCYSDSDQTLIYIPLGSDSTNYKYQLEIVDGNNYVSLVPTPSTSTTTPTNPTNPTGRAWRMAATPNRSNSYLKDAKAFYMDDNGVRVSYDHTVASSLVITATTVADSGTGISAW